jgi:hypothetical protein
MNSWYKALTIPGTLVLLSETGYTNIEIALQYLDHLYQYSGATAERPKVLLMDQHGSHMDDSFILKANKYNIYPYAFPGHLTHILQPLDVGVFQSYKHWHQKAVQHSIRNLEIDYNIASFFRDLKAIRDDTFKESTIQGAFRKAGVWPIKVQNALEKMRIYQPLEPLSPPNRLELPQLLQTPRKFSHAEVSLGQLHQELQDRDLSSPISRKIHTIFKGAKPLLVYGELIELQLQQSQAKERNQQLKKRRSRQYIQQSGALTTEQALERMAQKEAKAEGKKEKKRQGLI